MYVPSQLNIFAKDCEKISKYKDLKINIEKIWYLKIKKCSNCDWALYHYIISVGYNEKNLYLFLINN